MNLANLLNVIEDDIFDDYCENITSDLEAVLLYEACIDDIKLEAVEMVFYEQPR